MSHRGNTNNEGADIASTRAGSEDNYAKTCTNDVHLAGNIAKRHFNRSIERVPMSMTASFLSLDELENTNVLRSKVDPDVTAYTARVIYGVE